jgi:hypothetical protein
MQAEIKTIRTRRTWFERLRLWSRAYETKVYDVGREVVARGPTPEASEAAAIRQWNEPGARRLLEPNTMKPPSGLMAMPTRARWRVVKLTG